ncbi:MAG TPA: NAD(P)H-dependent oxidoreductase [Thiobacillaceae bacterium]|nr:NAD(P)H-dependent oxidoreductase [Thiobacillaceae bacterium]
MKSTLLDIFRKRHACHLFHSDKPLAVEDLAFILEAGRLSPSSFGLEQWKFVVLTGPAEKSALQEACFNQPQVGTASAVIVILARIAEMDPDSPHLRRLMAREYPDPEGLEAALRNYRNFHAGTDVLAWSGAQCHIAAANMMTAAAGIGIDSCAIGGFEPASVCRLLAVDPAGFQPVLILPLGYCAHAAGEKQRLSLEEVAEFR